MERQEHLNAVGQYVTLRNEIKTRVNDEQAALSILEQIGKDARVEKMSSRGGDRPVRLHDASGEAWATLKQLGYFERLGVPLREKRLTRKEASFLIDDALPEGIAA